MADDRKLNDLTLAVLATEGVERVELTEPVAALRDAGANVHLIAPQEEFRSFNGLDPADTVTADRLVNDASAGDYDALVLPGGVANPDHLRTDEDAVAFVRSFVDAGKVVAAICHAPWMLIEANAVNGRRLTSFHSLRTDLENAGARWVDEPVVVDRDGPNTLLTSRNPGDIAAFDTALIDELASGGTS